MNRYLKQISDKSSILSKNADLQLADSIIITRSRLENNICEEKDILESFANPHLNSLKKQLIAELYYFQKYQILQTLIRHKHFDQKYLQENFSDLHQKYLSYKQQSNKGQKRSSDTQEQRSSKNLNNVKIALTVIGALILFIIAFRKKKNLLQLIQNRTN